MLKFVWHLWKLPGTLELHTVQINHAYLVPRVPYISFIIGWESLRGDEITLRGTCMPHNMILCMGGDWPQRGQPWLPKPTKFAWIALSDSQGQVPGWCGPNFSGSSALVIACGYTCVLGSGVRAEDSDSQAVWAMVQPLTIIVNK